MTTAVLFERVQRDEEAQRPDEDDHFAEQARLARLEKAQHAREDFEGVNELGTRGQTLVE
jgi:hypothetical protein